MAESEGVDQNGDSEAELIVDGKLLPYGWSKGVNDDGMVYYQNNITNEIQYEVPTERAKPRPKYVLSRYLI